MTPKRAGRYEPAIASPNRTRTIVYGVLVLLDIMDAVREIARKAVITTSNDGIVSYDNGREYF